MNIARKVRQNYEERPYPPISRSRKPLPTWLIVPLEWVDAMCPTHTETHRILVAGCGTGNEAFAMRKHFPNAEIVAVDFSPRSIAMAKKQQKKFGERKIEFRSADLTSSGFAKDVDGSFDFISCHGVLSYVPNPARALKNLAQVLTDNGALYLGLNGARHFSQTWRPVLRDFAFDIDVFTDIPETRRFLKLCDALAEHDRLVARQSAEFLAGDLFGPLIRNHTLDEWIGIAHRSGLHFRGSYAAHRALRRIFNAELYDLLIPRSRAETHCIAERLAPSRFHQLVFTRTKPATVSWLDRDLLLRCRARPTRLYRIRLPKERKTARGLRAIRLTSAATNTVVELRAPNWISDILRAKNAKHPIRETLRGRSVSDNSLREQLYLLELLGAINLSPVT